MLGNYGKAFAYASKKLGLNHCTVAMPETAPNNRKDLILSYGVKVESIPSANLSMRVKQVIFHTNICYITLMLFYPWRIFTTKPQ